MRVVAQSGNQYVLMCSRGGELLQSLAEWCTENSIEAATLTGLGAADVLDLAYYHLDTKTYERHVIEEEVEILSLIGNVARLDDKTVLHIHGTFGRRDLTAFGGHLFSLRVSGACEIHLTKLEGMITRTHDEVTGLNLMCPYLKK